MDLYRRLNSDLEPLGGELLIDRFVQVRRAAAAAQRSSAATAAQAARRAAETARQDKEGPTVSAATVRIAGQAPPYDEKTDAERLRDEVEAFMNRNALEEPDNREVQEFLEENPGFDPTELG